MRGIAVRISIQFSFLLTFTIAYLDIFTLPDTLQKSKAYFFTSAAVPSYCKKVISPEKNECTIFMDASKIFTTRRRNFKLRPRQTAPALPSFSPYIFPLFLQILLPEQNAHTRFKGEENMKATGIVRRVDDCGIITQRGLCRINTGVLLILSKNSVRGPGIIRL